MTHPQREVIVIAATNTRKTHETGQSRFKCQHTHSRRKLQFHNLYIRLQVAITKHSPVKFSTLNFSRHICGCRGLHLCQLHTETGKAAASKLSCKRKKKISLCSLFCYYFMSSSQGDLSTSFPSTVPVLSLASLASLPFAPFATSVCRMSRNIALIFLFHQLPVISLLTSPPPAQKRQKDVFGEVQLDVSSQGF